MDDRRLQALVLAAVLLIGLAGCSEDEGPTAPPSPPSTRPPASTPAEVVEFVDLVNAHRTSMGLGELVWDDAVAVVATAHSADMIERQFFDHVNPDGDTPFDRLHDAGIVYVAAGENIAYGYPIATSVFEGWLGSPGHRANIEYPRFTHHGVGLVGTHWTHVFLRKPD
jgi:uncharacterized protein YkwD